VGHSITALIVRGRCDPAAAAAVDLRPVILTGDLTLLHIDHNYAAYWQSVRGVVGELDVPEDFPTVFPRERVLASLVESLVDTASPAFAILMTDYFGGVGDQWACAFSGVARCPSDATINGALRCLGVTRRPGRDEFDTVGLSAHRSPPDDLDRYVDLCQALEL